MASPMFELAGQHQAYSRKQKSLGLLCSNFVGLYDRDGVESIGLDDAARRLGVERRRIYDIVNVLESVGVIVRKAKNQYSWIGFSGIPKALDDLKEDALREISGSCVDDGSNKVSEDEEDEEFGEEKLSQASNASNNGPHKSRSESKREKSLGQLTQNFVKLFLTTKVDMISLDDAARLLLGDGLDSCQMRNNNAAKVRRLYDIGNVLCSMNLIEKTQQADTRKPAFRWLGTEGKPSIDSSNEVTVAIPPNTKYTKQLKKRTFGTELTNVESKRSKSVSLVDKKPFKEQTRSDVLKECNLTAQKQLGGSKSYVFGPFHPVEEVKAGGNGDDRAGKKVQDWESMASSFRPHYHNQALNELFVHYMEAWKSWYSEITQGSNIQVPCKSAISQLLQ